MDMKSIAITMLPYWALGAATVWATAKSKWRSLVRVDKKALFKFAKFLTMITIYRVILFKLLPDLPAIKQAGESINLIPWPLTLTVFWEDACHGLPLLLLRKMIGTEKKTWPIHALVTGLFMLEFGLGHVYQGVLAACLLSLYVPYSVKLGEKYGFGTVMIGHSLFDLVTIWTVKLILGA